MEIADRIGTIKTGHPNLIPDNYAEVRGNIAATMCAWERKVDFRMPSYEEALALDSNNPGSGWNSYVHP
jgi:hypothetical protein